VRGSLAFDVPDGPLTLVLRSPLGQPLATFTVSAEA
jgi:hypothetical protein